MNIPLKEDLKIDELTVYENLEAQFYEMFNKKMDSLTGFNLFKRIYVSFLQKEPFNMYFKKGTREVILFENENEVNNVICSSVFNNGLCYAKKNWYC